MFHRAKPITQIKSRLFSTSTKPRLPNVLYRVSDQERLTRSEVLARRTKVNFPGYPSLEDKLEGAMLDSRLFFHSDRVKEVISMVQQKMKIGIVSETPAATLKKLFSAVNVKIPEENIVNVKSNAEPSEIVDAYCWLAQKLGVQIYHRLLVVSSSPQVIELMSPYCWTLAVQGFRFYDSALSNYIMEDWEGLPLAIHSINEELKSKTHLPRVGYSLDTNKNMHACKR